jgi:hypothetical protein
MKVWARDAVAVMVFVDDRTPRQRAAALARRRQRADAGDDPYAAT